MFVDAPDVVLHTAAFGPASDTRTPLLALSGWSASWQAWAPSFEHLSKLGRSLTYDTRGTAGSPCHPDAVTFDTLVDDVFRVLDAHEIDRCVLAGESLGGFVALNAALREPARFEHLVLISVPPAIEPLATGRLVAGARLDYDATVEEFAKTCLNEPGSERLWRWGAALFRGADAECAARLFECCYGHTPDLARVRTPTTVIHGALDLVVPPAHGRHLAATIPAATYIELDCGHAPTVTKPQEVARLVTSICAW